MRMVVDGEWPADFQPTHEGKPTYEDMVAYCTLQGCVVSRSAVGRWSQKLRLLSRYRSAAAIVRDVMKDVTAEKASETQKAVAEMITAEAIGLLGESDGLDSKQIQQVARAIKDCTAIAINADKYIHEQLAAKVKEAGKAIEQIAAKNKKQIDPETLKQIREQVYGIIH